MLKKINIFLLCSYFGLNIHAQENFESKELYSIREKYGTSSISNFCNLVYRRYYFLARMQRAILLISQINVKINNIPDEDSIKLAFPKPTMFSQLKIKYCINQFAVTKNFNSVLDLWEEFSAYKEIDNPVILEEFARLIFLIFKNFYFYTQKESIHKNDYELEKLYSNLIMLPLPQLLELIDIITKFNTKKNEDLNTIENLLSDILSNNYFENQQDNLKYNVNHYHETELVSHRFFFIQRLSKPINLLEKSKIQLSSNSKVIIVISKFLKNNLETLKLNNDEIELATKKVIELKTITPILDLWTSIKEYKNAGNEDFLRQFIKIVFLIYKNWVKISKNEESISENEILQDYNEFSSLPLMDMLEKIDSMATEINDDMKKQKIAAKKPLWRKIAYKFWWLPTIISAASIYCYMKKQS